MRIRLLLIALLGLAAPAYADPPALDHSKVGVYGVLFDFCDYSVYKFGYKDRTELSEKLTKWRQMLAESSAQGKANLVLLYTFDRVKHAHPIDEYIRDTDTVLRALDPKTIYALCLSEENVTWNNGLQVLNSLYDHIKANYPLTVYQWLTMPDLPHPKLRADGWVIDPYGFDRARFRRYLQKYIATGKPVIDCITASPDPGAPFNETPAQQVEVCREFNVPMFFYCVDRKWGSPAIWLRSTDPEIVKPREWLMGVVSELHRDGARGLPVESANFSTGVTIEAAGDERGIYEYVDSLDTEQFADDATIRGFLGLRWDGEKETLLCDPAKARLPVIELQYHFTSLFRISDVKAEISGRQEGDPLPTMSLGLSENGHQWNAVAQTQSRGDFSLTAQFPKEATRPGKEFWVRVTVSAPTGGGAGRSILDLLRVTCRTAPPERRETALEPDAEGKIAYTEDFASRKYLHLADIQGGETLEWRRGGLSTHGVKGRKNVVEVRWKFVSARPLKDVVVSVAGTAFTRNLGAANSAGLSLDGKNILLRDDTTGKKTDASGRCKEPLTLDARMRPEFSGVREFYLHITMTNRSGALTHTSNTIKSLTVSATVL